jgi:hypothetical protein
MTLPRMRAEDRKQGREPMTPSQLAHLAEQAEFAAGFFAVTNPAAARRFSDAATTALQMSTQLERREQLARLRAELADIRRRLDRRARARQALTPGFASDDPAPAGSTRTLGESIDV